MTKCECRIWACASLALLSITAYTAPAGLPSDILEQLKDLPDEQKAQIAGQYGLEPTAITGNRRVPIDGIGAPGEPTTQERRFRYVGNDANETRSDDADINELERFGVHIFDKYVTTFAPVDNIPVPEGYLLGPGDKLEIMLYGTEQYQHVLELDREGTISFPKLGSIVLSGLTYDQAKVIIEERVARQLSGTDVVISMGRLRSISTFLSGEVRHPGIYSVSALATLSQVLYSGGGISDIGSIRNISVFRSGELARKFDLYDLLLYGKSVDDIRINSGDVVFVPPVGPTVSVDGAIRRPAIYELAENETLGQLIEMAGGIDNRAYIKNVRLRRHVPGETLPKLFNVDLTERSSLEMALFDGDAVEIYSIVDRPRNAVHIKGAHARGGLYACEGECRASNYLSDPYGDLDIDADLGVALIIRRHPSLLGGIEVLGFSPIAVLNEPLSKSDPTVYPGDEILFFSRARISNKPVVEKVPADIELERLRQLNLHESGATTNPLEITSNGTENRVDTSLGDESDTAGAVLLNNERDGQETNLDNVEFDTDPRISRSKYHSRRTLLEPVMEQLKRQSSETGTLSIVNIGGAVRIPGEYPLLINQGIKGLIRLAGGITDDAYLGEAEVRRVDSIFGDKVRTSVRRVNLRDQLDKGSSIFSLKGRDFVRINFAPQSSIDQVIRLEGEVVFPGEYVFASGETLGSILRRAGGLTSEAFPEAAVLNRITLKEQEQQQLMDLANRYRRHRALQGLVADGSRVVNSQSEPDDNEIIMGLLSVQTPGRLIIDLPRILIGDRAAAVQIQDGDVLKVPRYANTVNVVGEVLRAGSFGYRENFSVADYLEMAAGVSERAKKKRIYVIKANGSVEQKIPNLYRRWVAFEPSLVDISPGDTIVVPLNQRYEQNNLLVRTQTVTQVLFNGLASIAAVVGISGGNH